MVAVRSHMLWWGIGCLLALGSTLLTPPASAQRAPAAMCMGEKVTVIGTAGADRLRGTKRTDVIAALGGPDRITRVTQRDRVCAGGGRDRVVSKPTAGRAQGRARLGRGQKQVGGLPPAGTSIPPPLGGSGLGLLVLGGGSDELVISCDPAALYPQTSINEVFAGGGDDLLDSDCPFTDFFRGGAGDDVIRLGFGRDNASGDEGDDLIIDAYSVPTDCALGLPPLSEGMAGYGYPDRRCVGAPLNGWMYWEDQFDGGLGNDRIVGGIANDFIVGGDGDDLLGGGPGQDNLQGGAGADVCDGGEGDGDTNQRGPSHYPSAGDCEQASGMEPFAAYLPRPNCASDQLDPERFDDCLWNRPEIRELSWERHAIDVSAGPGELRLQLMLWGDRPEDRYPCNTCAPYHQISTVEVVIASDAGERRRVELACPRRPAPEPASRSDFICETSFDLAQGAPTANWTVESLTLFDEGGGWSRYVGDSLDPLWANSWDGHTHAGGAVRVWGTADSAGPTLDRLTVSQGDAGGAERPVRIELDASDDVSGLRSAFITVTSVDGSFEDDGAWLEAPRPTALHATFSRQLSLPPGDYEVSLGLYDQAWNGAGFSSEELTAAGWPGRFTVR